MGKPMFRNTGSTLHARTIERSEADELPRADATDVDTHIARDCDHTTSVDSFANSRMASN